MGFVPVTNDQAYLKMGLMGLQGSGKTHTAAAVAIGLRNILAEKKLPGGDSPVYMIDTEVGSSWLLNRFKEAGIPLHVDKTRAFRDLVDDCRAAAEEQAIVVIDSITHFWRELCEAYATKYRRRRLTFQDWGTIKSVWSEFTDLYVNGTFHGIMSGRQGYEYDFFEDDDGKKQLEKTGVKMKGEAETGYEPSLLVVMQRHQTLGNNGSIERVWRTAYVLKDRADVIDGQAFENPTFESFRPHIEHLNLGGEHVGVDVTRNSEDLIPKEDKSWQFEREQSAIVLEEVQELLKKHYPSQTADDKQYRIELIEKFFKTRSWKKVETMDLNELKDAYNRLHLELEKVPAYPNLPIYDPGAAMLPSGNSEIPF